MAKTKTFAALTSEKHRSVMETALPSGSLLYTDPNPDVARFLADQAEKHTDVVVIDDAGMPYKDINEHDVYTFPSTQSSNGHHVQIIFIPAATRVAGDSFIADLISVGIYDIVDPHTKDLKKTIAKMAKTPSVFGDAQTWLTDKIKAQNPATKKSSSAGLFGSLRKKKKAVTDEDAAVFLEAKTEDAKDAETKTPATTKSEVERPSTSDTAVSNDVERLRAEIHAVNAKKKAIADAEPAEAIKVDSLRGNIANVAMPKTDKAVVSDVLPAESKSVPASNPIIATPAVEDKIEAAPVISSKTTTEGMTIEQLNELVDSRVQEEVLAQLKQQMRAENQKRIAVSGLTRGSGSTTFAAAIAVWIAKEMPSKRVVCCMADTEELAQLAKGTGSKNGQTATLCGVSFVPLDSAFPEGDIVIFDCGVKTSKEVTAASELSHKQYVIFDGSPLKHTETIAALVEKKMPESTIWVVRNGDRGLFGRLANEAKIKMPRQRTFNATWDWTNKTIPNMEYFAGDVVGKPKAKTAQVKGQQKAKPIAQKHQVPSPKQTTPTEATATQAVEKIAKTIPEPSPKQEDEGTKATPAVEGQTGAN